MSFTARIPVRFSDIDHAGIMYYPRFFHLFHVAFEELWRDRLGARAYADLLNRDRVGFPAVKAACEFRSPLKFGDTAEVEVRISRMGTKSIAFRYDVFRAEDSAGPRALAAEGSVVCAVVDLARFTAVETPSRVRELLADLVE